MQMLLAAMLIHALHAALEDRIEAFNRVRGDYVDTVANVFLFAMVDRAVAVKLAAYFHVVSRFVGHELAFPANVGPQDRRNVRDRRAVDMEAAGRAAALNERQNDILVSATRWVFRLA